MAHVGLEKLELTYLQLLASANKALFPLGLGGMRSLQIGFTKLLLTFVGPRVADGLETYLVAVHG